MSSIGKLTCAVLWTWSGVGVWMEFKNKKVGGADAVVVQNIKMVWVRVWLMKEIYCQLGC